MSKEVIINGDKYSIITNLKNDDNKRVSFNKLVEKTFEFNFNKWFEQGYWSDNYIPYSLVNENNEVVSNVSVNEIDF